MPHLPKDHERFAKLAAAFQSIAIGTAVIVGGIWTIYTFRALWTAEIAEISARETRDREGAIELAMRVQPVVAYVTDSKSPQGSPTALRPAMVLKIEVDVTNSSTGTHAIDLQRLPIGVKRIYSYRFYPDGRSDEGEPDIAWRTTDATDEIRIAPKTKTTLHFAIAVPNPGVYSVTFKTPASATSGNSLGRQLFKNPDAAQTQRHWAVNALVVVSPVDRDAYPPLPESSTHLGNDGPLWKQAASRKEQRR